MPKSRPVPSPAERRWRAVLERFSKSGLNARAFCGRENLREHQFHYWKRELRLRDLKRTRPAPAFVPLAVAPGAFVPVIEIELPGGARLRAGAGAGPDLVAKILSLLGSPAC